MRVRVLAIASAATLLALSASLAGAEVSQKEGIRVSVTGKISPNKLPRQGAAPVTVSVGGHILPTRAGLLPRLLKIKVAINRHGKLDLNGLPRCRLGHIDPSTTAEALEACGDSLVGEGTFSADVKIPDQSPFPSVGKVYAFNGRLHGKPAIFAHIYGTKPVPTTNVTIFTIDQRSSGTYGTVLEADLPRVAGEWGYVTGLSLELNRTYTSHGKKHSYLTASCPAPKNFNKVLFPLARTTFSFDEGVNVTSTLNRTCKVKG